MGLGLVDKPHLQRFKSKLDIFLNETFVKKTDVATTNHLGIVKPDGTTITIDENGIITGNGGYTLPTASTDTLGGVKIDGTTVTIDENGVISSSGGSGGSSVEWTQTQSSGTKIAEIDIDGNSQDVYAPTPTTVEANPQGTATGTLTKLQVGADIYEVSGGGGSSTLADLTDTDITTPSDNQDLVYDNTSSKWKNKTTRIELTQAQYNALSYAEKHNGCMYYITDAGGPSGKFTPIGLGECYSTEERMIGCWTDGKPLYQKSFDNIDPTQHLGQNILLDASLTLDNVEIVKIDGSWAIGGYHYLASQQSSIFKTIYFNNQTVSPPIIFNNTNGLYFNTNQSNYGEVAKITVQYTKVSDTAGSGSWTPSGVPAVHYSTTEQVIGTWIDGKTLYQKTFELTDGDPDIDVSYNSWQAISVNIPNVKTLIKGDIIAYDGTYQGPVLVWNDNGTIKIQSPRNSTAYARYITIQYTKTS